MPKAELQRVSALCWCETGLTGTAALICSHQAEPSAALERVLGAVAAPPTPPHVPGASSQQLRLNQKGANFPVC